ncbi:MAG TPA: FAD-dependent oxidoreductase, partial [Ilumatobacteraceae bacterium]|nr:FAD-dependent oxidoreductase [Ilumatobacteraceae bacterium]
MRRIVIVGGGYAGFYTAWKLEKKLRPSEAELVIIDPRPYMTYQPFLPEVAAGSIEARHAAVSLRSHLTRTRIIAGGATMISHAEKTVTVRPADGPDFVVDYDIIVVTAGAVTRVLPIPGADEVEREIGEAQLRVPLQQGGREREQLAEPLDAREPSADEHERE